MKKGNLSVIQNITPGLRVRVYQTSFCKPKPDDLYLDCYVEGVITRHEKIMDYITRVYYRIDKILIAGKNSYWSWKVGTEGDFSFNHRISGDTHYVFNVSNQLQLTTI